MSRKRDQYKWIVNRTKIKYRRAVELYNSENLITVKSVFKNMAPTSTKSLATLRYVKNVPQISQEIQTPVRYLRMKNRRVKGIEETVPQSNQQCGKKLLIVRPRKQCDHQRT